MANLAIFCDGTWNTPDELDEGLPAPTNVVRAYNALAERDGEGQLQKTYYHPGVGTNGGWWDRIAGGGTGEGLDRNIMSAYRWLGARYRPGDRIFLFGFSRGAYTVRSLAGMITRCGLLDLAKPGLRDEEAWDSVHEIFDCYRKQKSAEHLSSRCHSFEGVPYLIHFLGAWDTVGALGIPKDLALLNLIDDPARHSFHDTELSTKVRRARHAVALDELRASFWPTLWSNTREHPDVKQVWFPGVHGDVGGGYGRTGLSDEALCWMIGEAGKEGLAFRDSAIDQIKPDPRGVLHDSWKGIFKALKTRPRSTPLIGQRSVDQGCLHPSALARHEDPPLDQPPYWPTDPLEAGDGRKVEIFARQTWNNTGIYLTGGVAYEFTAIGQWVDGSIKCGPEGTADGRFEIGEVAHVAASALGKVELLFKRVTGNAQADFWWTRREEDMPWFGLVGVVANGQVDETGQEIEHETFLIGKGESRTPRASGYLYCFANDAWQAYGNNLGSVTLLVKRA